MLVHMVSWERLLKTKWFRYLVKREHLSRHLSAIVQCCPHAVVDLWKVRLAKMRLFLAEPYIVLLYSLWLASYIECFPNEQKLAAYHFTLLVLRHLDCLRAVTRLR